MPTTLHHLADIADELAGAKGPRELIEARYIAALKGRIFTLIDEAHGPVARVHVEVLDPHRSDWLFLIEKVELADGAELTGPTLDKLRHPDYDSELFEHLSELCDRCAPQPFVIDRPVGE